MLRRPWPAGFNRKFADRVGLHRRGIRRGESRLRGAARLGARQGAVPFARADLPSVLRQDNLDYDKIPRNPLPPRPRALGGGQAAVRVEFSTRLPLFGTGHVNEFTSTHTQPIRFVQDFLTTASSTSPAQIRPDGLRRFPRAVSAEPAGATGRTRRVSRRELFPPCSAKISATAIARGLALDCGEGEPGRGIPHLHRLVLGKPAGGDNELRLYAISTA